MHFSIVLLFALGICAQAAPIAVEAVAVARGLDADEDVVYPDETFYAEDFKRSVDTDENVVYPDETFYAEDFKKRAAADDADENVVYPDETFYAEDF